MAKTKTKAPKRATRVKAPSSKKTTATPTPVGHLDSNARPQLADGAPVFVRYDVGQYKLGILMRRTHDGKPVVRIGGQDAKGRYTGTFASERVLEPGEISRVFMERDWESIAIARPESGNDCDARIARGPSHDELQRPMNDNGAHPDVITMDVRDDESAEKACEAILVGRDISRGTMHGVARWVLHMHEIAETWKRRVDELEDEQPNEPERTKVKPDEAKPYEQRSAKARVRVGDIVSIKGQRDQWISAKVTMIDDNDVHFVDVDDNGGSRFVSQENYAWRVSTTHGREWFDTEHAHRQAERETKRAEHVAKQETGEMPKMVPATMPAVLDEPGGRSRRVLPKVGELIHVESMGDCVVESCARGYLTFRSTDGGKPGRRRTSDASWQLRRPPGGVAPSSTTANLPAPPAVGSHISVRTGGAWEVVKVVGYDEPSRIVSFHADDNVTGILRMGDLDRSWRMLSSAELARLNKATAPATLAQGAEKERKAVERQGNKAARAATGGKPSPVDRAVADAMPKMVVTSERMGPPIEQAFIDETPAPAAAALSLQRRNVLASKRLGISLHEVMDRRADGTLELGPEDREADAESRRTRDRDRAGLNANGYNATAALAAGALVVSHGQGGGGGGGGFVSLPRIGDVVYIMSVSGWARTSVIRVGGTIESSFVVQGGLTLQAYQHGTAWISEREHDQDRADAVDGEELAVAGERELRDMGLRRDADGIVRHINGGGVYTPAAVVDADESFADSGRMPWDEE